MPLVMGKKTVSYGKEDGWSRKRRRLVMEKKTVGYGKEDGWLWKRRLPLKFCSTVCDPLSRERGGRGERSH